MPKQHAASRARAVAILRTWPVSIAVLSLLSTALLHVVRADSSSGSSSQENSSESMANVHSQKDREHVLRNETTKNQESFSPTEDTPEVLPVSGTQGGESPSPSDALEDKLGSLLVLKSGLPTEKKASYYDAEVIVQSAADPVVKNPDETGKTLQTGDAEVSFRGDLDGVVAVAQLLRYTAAATPVAEESGYIVFHQAKPLQAVRVLGTLELITAPTSVKIEIHANADNTNSCQNVGRIYNPFGVSDGGVVLRSGATIQSTYVSFFKDDRNILQLTLYGDSKVIGKSVVVYNEANIAVACGIIRETTNF